jgi:hydroxylamine reductase
MSIKKPEFTETFKDVLIQGKIAGRSMEYLDRSHNHVFGHPTPTEVPMTPVPGKAILVSGHDITATKRLLEQTEGTGINI